MILNVVLFQTIVAGESISAPIGWDCCSLPRAVHVVFVSERQSTPDADLQAIGRVEATIGRDWIESRYFYIHGDIGEELNNYRYATPEKTFDYSTTDRLANVSDNFAKFGTAFGASSVSPFDPIRMMIRASENGRDVEVETRGETTVYQFTPMNIKDGLNKTELVFDSEKRLVSESVWTGGGKDLSTTTEYRKYQQMSDGSWFPMEFKTKFFTGEIGVILNTVAEIDLYQGDGPPPRATLPPDTTYVDAQRGVQVDAEGNVIGPVSALQSGAPSQLRLPKDWLSYLFTGLGAAMLIGAGLIWKYRSA